MWILNIEKWTRFWKLVVIWEGQPVNWRKNLKCKCDCWNIQYITLKKIKSRIIPSCGCKSKSRTHWMSNQKYYDVWYAMKSRCNNPKNPRYKNYWWRWITYDPSWDKFEWFWEDMWWGYKEWLTLERVNVNGNYNKENCKWATYKEQNRNTTRNVYCRWICMKDRCIELWVWDTCITNRIKRGWSIEEAFWFINRKKK